MIRPLRIGIVGLNFGRHVVHDLLQPDLRRYFQIAAVCDLDENKARAMSKRIGVKVYTELDALLADPTIPVIGLFIAPNKRAETLRRVLRAGKDAMTTKPFENDPDEAETVLCEAIKLKRVVHLNSPAPNLPPDLAQVARWREKYDLGRPVGARGEIWASYREKPDGCWYDDPARCPVAPVFRLGIYLINDLIRLLGDPCKVQVSHSRLFTARPTPDNAQLAISFKNGALANIYASFCVDDAQYYRNSLTLNFERGTVYRNVGPSPTNAHARMELAIRGKTDRSRIIRKEISSISGMYDWRGFYHAVKRREPPTPQFIRDVVGGLRVISAMGRAEKSETAERVG